MGRREALATQERAHHVSKGAARRLSLDDGAHARGTVRRGARRREAEVGQPHVPIVARLQHVLELEVAVHEARGVQLIEARRDLLEQAQPVEHRAGPAHAAPREERLLQRAAALKAHYKSEQVRRRTRIGVGGRLVSLCEADVALVLAVAADIDVAGRGAVGRERCKAAQASSALGLVLSGAGKALRALPTASQPLRDAEDLRRRKGRNARSIRFRE